MKTCEMKNVVKKEKPTDNVIQLAEKSGMKARGGRELGLENIILDAERKKGNEVRERKKLWENILDDFINTVPNI